MTKNNVPCFAHLSSRLALVFIATFALARTITAAENPSAPIPFSELGARATANYHGDAIGIQPIAEGAQLHTAFQKLSGSVTRDGLWLKSTEAEGGQLHLVASAIGERKLPSHGTVAIGDKVVSFKRPGLTEEYSVSVDGVRQDFLIPARPRHTGELIVALELSGAKAKGAAYGVKLTLDGSGRELAYSRLRVTDATGRELSAKIEVVPANRLSVRVADANATYPIRIDPTFSDADWVSLNSSIPGTNGGGVAATVVDGSGNVYIGGSFTIVGNVAANNIAKWNGSAWSALGSGMDQGVVALAVSGTTLYAGGVFTTAGGVSANGIAQWNGSAWSALGLGMDPNGPAPNTTGDSGVHALAVSGSVLYAGGEFNTAGTVTARHIAQWNGSSWSAVGSGVSGPSGAGGQIDSGAVYALAVSGPNLFVGGRFTFATPPPAGSGQCANIVVWDGSVFSSVGGGTAGPCGGGSQDLCPPGPGGTVRTVAVSGTDLYIGGDFVNAGNLPNTVGIAKYSGGFSALGSGIDFTGFHTVSALAVSGSTLYVAGDFAGAGGQGSTKNLAKWNGSVWNRVVDEFGGPNAGIGSLAVNGTDLYIGGGFTATEDFPANRIAKKSGAFFTSFTPGMSGDVYALAINGTDVYAGGSFVVAGNNTLVNHIAKWNGSIWSKLGNVSEGGTDGIVRALLFSGTDLYAGGDFLIADAVPANCVAKWDGTNWSALGAGVLKYGGSGGPIGDNSHSYDPNNQLPATVYALALDNNNRIYVGGDFTHINGFGNVGSANEASFIARWVPPPPFGTWEKVGSGSPYGVTGPVYALTGSGSTIYVGGKFAYANGFAQGPPVNSIAKFVSSAGLNGTWSTLGGGVVCGNMCSLSNPNSVYALALNGTDLFVGGDFAVAVNSPGGPVPNTTYIAKWDGSAWSALGSGITGTAVNALAVAAGDVYAGGDFSMAGGVAANNIAKWSGGVWSPLGSGTDDIVRALATGSNFLFVGGGFDYAGVTISPFIARGDLRADQTITFPAIPDKTYGDPDFTVSATATSGLAVTFSASGNATVTGNTVHLTGPGSATITASQSGNATYKPAPNVPRSFNIALNPVPSITPSTGLSRQQGTAATNSQIATVNDQDNSPGSLTVTAPTVPAGLTITNIVNTNGTITANIAASCTSPTGTRTIVLQVSDGTHTSTGNLDINVTANSAPVLTYNNPAPINIGGSTTVNPASASDNGTITSLALQSEGTYTGTIAVNPSTGVVSISNAKPGGTHTITVRATDNCGATTDASFSLQVSNTAPSITASSGLSRQQGTAASNSTIATVSDAESSAGSLVITATTVPPGLTISNIVNTNGTVTANIAAGCAAATGNNTIVLQASDGSLTKTANLVINVTANSAPVLNYANPPTVAYTANFLWSPTTTSDNGTATYALQSQGTFTGAIAVDSSNGKVGLNTAAPPGTHTITIRATDNCGAITDASFSVTVADTAPSITASSGLSRQQGGPTSTSTIATVNDAESNIGSLTVTAPTVPAGLTISNIVNTNGSIKADIVASCGIATGNQTIVLQVSDGVMTANANLVINVTANTAPVLTYANSAVSLAGSGTVNPATASDNGTVSYALHSQGTYTGTISVNSSTGVVSISNAMPVGTSTITVRATDNCGATTDASFSLQVNNTNTAPTITPVANARVQGSPAVNHTIATVSDTESSAGTLTVTAITVPAGLTISNIVNTNGTVTADIAASCSISTGNKTIVLQVSDGNLTTNGNLTLNVLANTVPVLTYSNPASVAAGGSTSVSPATSSDNGTQTFSIFSQGTYTGTISVNATGVVSISNATPVGSHTITIRATDNCGATKDASFTLPVYNPAALDSLDASIVGDDLQAIAVQPDGKIIIGGTFDHVHGITRNNIARLNADGTLDLGFDPNPFNSVSSIVVQPDGKILITGTFFQLQPNGAPSSTIRNNIARLNADGTVDTGFDPNAIGAQSMALQPDGKILVGGSFTSLAGGSVTRNRIARLNSNGTVDSGFDPNANGSVSSVAVQPDGKVVLGGGFTTLKPNGAPAATTRNFIARLNSDGTLDTGFDPKANNQVNCIALQPDGKVVLGGFLTNLQPNGAPSPTTRNRIARVNSDGTLDTGFNPNANNEVDCMTLQTDGKVLFSGTFTTVQPNGAPSPTTRNLVARVNGDGTVDSGFDPNAAGSFPFVWAIALQTDGKVLLGGRFSTLQPNGTPVAVPRTNFARLFNDAATQSFTAPDTSQILWSRGGTEPEVSQVTFATSASASGPWTALGNGSRVGTTPNWQLTGLSLPTSGYLRARGLTTTGYFNGSSSLIEQVVAYTTSAPLTLNIGQVGIATLNAGTNTTNVTVNFTSVPNATFNLQYATSLPASWIAYTGNPVNSGPAGAFSVTFTASGDQTAAWNSKMFFQATGP